MSVKNDENHLPPYDNFRLLEMVCLLLHAGHDLINSEMGEVYLLLRDYPDEVVGKKIRQTLELLHTSIGGAFQITKMLLRAERGSWEA